MNTSVVEWTESAASAHEERLGSPWPARSAAFLHSIHLTHLLTYLQKLAVLIRVAARRLRHFRIMSSSKFSIKIDSPLDIRGNIPGNGIGSFTYAKNGAVSYSHHRAG